MSFHPFVTGEQQGAGLHELLLSEQSGAEQTLAAGGTPMIGQACFQNVQAFARQWFGFEEFFLRDQILAQLNEGVHDGRVIRRQGFPQPAQVLPQQGFHGRPLALKLEHEGHFVERCKNQGMVVSHQFPAHREGLTSHSFRLNQFALVAEDDGQFLNRVNRGQRLLVAVQCHDFAISRFGLGQPAFQPQDASEIVEGQDNIRVVAAQQFPLHFQRRALRFFRFRQFSLVGQIIRQPG